MLASSILKSTSFASSLSGRGSSTKWHPSLSPVLWTQICDVLSVLFYFPSCSDTAIFSGAPLFELLPTFVPPCLPERMEQIGRDSFVLCCSCLDLLPDVAASLVIHVNVLECTGGLQVPLFACGSLHVNGASYRQFTACRACCIPLTNGSRSFSDLPSPSPIRQLQ